MINESTLSNGSSSAETNPLQLSLPAAPQATDDSALPTEEAMKILERVVDLSNLFLGGTRSKEHDWYEELGAVLKNSHTTPANMTFALRDGSSTGAHGAVAQSLQQMLTLLRDALLRMRYREVTEILKAIIDGCRVSMPLALEIVIRRAGLEIMYNNSHIADLPIQEFFDILGGINTSINQQQVIIEQFIHNITSNKFDEAIECISFLPKLPRGMSATSHGKQTGALYRAYKGFAHYLEWNKAQSAGETYTQADLDRLEQLAENSIAEFSTVVDEEGVWDMFISQHAELLVFLGRLEAAESLLERYKTKDDTNPNTYRLLLRFYEGSDKDLEYLRTLKQYCTRWPADKTLCLKLVGKLKDADPSMCAHIYFTLLDYSCHSDDLELWQNLHTFLADSHQNQVVGVAISQEYKKRETWWVSYHFTKRTADHQSNLDQIKQTVYITLKGL